MLQCGDVAYQIEGKEVWTSSSFCQTLFRVFSAGVFVHSRLQDENLQVTISKLPYGSLTCTRGDFPCTEDIKLKSPSEG